MLLTDNFVFDLVAVLATLGVGLIAFIKYRFGYWTRIGLKQLTPSIPFGNAQSIFFGKESIGEMFTGFYKQLKEKNLKYGGVYFGLRPFFIVTDLEVVKNILQKDFPHFVNHGNYFNEAHDPLAANLFNLEDAKWRNMRVKLTPTFTSGKMKMMFHTLTDCAVGLKDVTSEAAKNQRPVDIKDILARFTTDIIGSCAFGLECNSLKDPNAEFRKYGRRLFENNVWDRLRFAMIFSMPPWFIDFFQIKFVKNDVEKFFMKAVKDTVEYRETNNIYRKDFMHLLLQLKNRGKITDDDKIIEDKIMEKALTINQLSAQAFVFFVAGFETSSTTMTFALYELATNQDIQERLRQEIKTTLAKHNNELTYECVLDMGYLDKVLSETLRKHPPVPILFRKCTKDYKLPNTSVVIKEGTRVVIPSLGIQTDPKYYPNPDKFDPERFSEQEKNKRPAFTWLPFGEGPRLCIGLRFGLMQSKVGLITLLQDYKVSLNHKTKLPLVIDKQNLIRGVEGGIWLNIENIS